MGSRGCGLGFGLVSYQFDSNVFVSQPALCSVQQSVLIEGHEPKHDFISAGHLEIVERVQNQAALLVVRGSKNGAIGI